MKKITVGKFKKIIDDIINWTPESNYDLDEYSNYELDLLLDKFTDEQKQDYLLAWQYYIHKKTLKYLDGYDLWINEEIYDMLANKY